MTDRFEFEQRILDCWNVTKDIDVVYKQVCDFDRPSDDELANVLLGLKTLYQMKFDQLFDLFEKNVKAGRFK